MKFLHTADLHLGRRLNDMPLMNDQKVMLEEITGIAVSEEVDAVIIAGDVYDKSIPGADAMSVFDDFISGLAEKNINVYMISGNHDSSERISYFSGIISRAGIHTSEAFDGKLQTIEMQDIYGPLKIHLMPFIRPLQVRRFYPDMEIVTYEDAVKAVLENSSINEEERNILVGHQFIIGAEISDSEEFAVGGLDSISAGVFDAFDYVALGHLHKAQQVKRNTMRYAGAPLKYSIAEANHKKSVTLINMHGKKEEPEIKLVPLTAVHDVREIRGNLSEILDMPYSEDYVRVIITDEMVPPDARVTVSTVFPNMIALGVVNSRSGSEDTAILTEDIKDKSKMDLFCDFYSLLNNGVAPEEEQTEIMKDILQELEEEAYETN